MLVLSRKTMQSVMIGSDIRITVIRLEGNQVRIGIEAPQDVRILRGELLEEPEAASEVSSSQSAGLATVMS